MESILHALAIFTFAVPGVIAAVLATRRFGVLAGFVLVVAGKFAMDSLVGLNLGFGARSGAMGVFIGLLFGWSFYWAYKTDQEMKSKR
ncbi:hypothetical protein ACF8FF_07230 [Pseudomonas sp. zjy_13]|uniref:hypothetical protein n=1 Tax=Pseudomonas sp. zjy_13 TaxID=3367263 RepID=UPI00370C8563